MVLNELFPDWLVNGGIFTLLQSFDVPWRLANIQSELDLFFHGEYCGNKPVSPLMDTLTIGGVIPSNNKTLLASTIYNLNSKNWNKLWATLNFDYNPIYNYSMTETMTNERTETSYGKTETQTNDLHQTLNGTIQETPNIQEVEMPDTTTTNNKSVYGFNSATAVPSDIETIVSDGTITKNRTGQDTTTSNSNTANTGTVSNVEGGSDTVTRNYSLSREGNIGVTTSQKMIESERGLWLWNYFFDTVFPDISKMVTIAIY